MRSPEKKKETITVTGNPRSLEVLLHTHGVQPS